MKNKLSNSTNLLNGNRNKIFGMLSHVVLAVGIIIILALMILPMPPIFLDVLLTLNITFAILILMVALYIKHPLELSVFPGLLLIVTIFRLALNISSTRLILGEAYAGEVINAFGNFVVKGNYVVGFIIFLILLIIQFIVIVKGAGRIAEVSARFTLDAMPGKQMAIDADMNAGLINEQDARERRADIAREAEFYGAMDGASKFVKGDAIAGLLITLINIVGGFIIGVAQMGMDFSTALQTYSLLTIGDGLVTQIPALIVGTAAGMVVTRSAAGKQLDSELNEQILGKPKALLISASALFLFAIIPGLPTIPFLLLSGATGAMGYVKMKNQAAAAKAVDEVKPPVTEVQDKIEDYLQVDPIELEIGFGLISLVDESQGGDLFNRITNIRKQVAIELGIIIPPLRVRDNLQLNPNQYILKIRGNIATSDFLYIDRSLAINAVATDQKLEGIQVKEPAFNLPAVWITTNERDKAELLGYTVVEPASVLSTHIQEILRRNAHKILGRQDTKKLVENLKKEYPAVVEELTPELLPTGVVQKVLQNLLREGIPIRDLATILESLVDYARVTKNVDVLTEYVRHSLAETIARLFQDEKGSIHAIAVDPKLEKLITNALQNQRESSPSLGLAPNTIQSIQNTISDNTDNAIIKGYQQIIICPATIRPYLYRLIHTAFPNVTVLSFTELPAETGIEFIGKLEINDEY